MEPALSLTIVQLRQIVDHLSSQLPEEACGLVGSQAGRAGLIMPVENILHSPVRFQMAPLEQFKAMERIESLGLDLAAIYHSHPTGPPHPSPTDLAEFYYPGTLVLIASPIPPGDILISGTQLGLWLNEWWLLAFQLERDQYNEVKLALFE